MKTDAREYIELLKEIQDSTSSTFTTLPTNEPRFIIDSNSREIGIPPEFSFIGVQNDHKAETIYFEIDRYFDDEDLSKHTCVVQFINKGIAGVSEGVHPVTEMDLSTEGKIVFGWEIWNDVTKNAGDIVFSIRFYSIKETDEEKYFDYNFNTLPSDSKILETLNVIGNAERIDPLEIEVWLDKIEKASKKFEQAMSDVNIATGAANTATENANSATENANKAADAAGNLNISAEQTATGATITITDREGVQTSVHIDTLTAIKTWEDVKNAVRLGLGATLFPVGYEFTTEDSVTGAVITWVVRGHDNHIAANKKLTHTMTLEAKYVYGTAAGTYKTLVFDAYEALYYAAEELPAGTYNFILDYTTSNVVSGTYQFTLTKAVPAGGQIVLGTNSNSNAITSCKIATYDTIAGTSAIESGIVVTEGSEGVNLGTIKSTSATSENLNCAQRILWGSNNYAQSAARQWLNSDAAAGGVWAPTNVFDRPPSWNTSYSGFMLGLPADFLAVVEPAAIPCRTNSIFEVNSLDGSEFAVNKVYTLKDKFFLLSRPEIYGTWDSATYKDGELLEFYDGLTDTERIKYDAAGSPRYCWLRSPIPGYANLERIVITSGAIDRTSAIYGFGVAPACIIA